MNAKTDQSPRSADVQQSVQERERLRRKLLEMIKRTEALRRSKAK